MGLWTRAKEALSKLAGAAETAWSVTKSVWNWPVSGLLLSAVQVTRYLAIDLPPAAGRYAIKTYKDKQTRKVIRHLGYIAKHDWPVIIAASTTTDFVYQYLSNTDAENNPMSIYHKLLTQTTIFGLYTGYYLFKVRQSQQVMSHEAIVILENGRAITKPIMNICTEEECSTARFMQGSGRNLFSYFVTTLSLAGLSYPLEWFLPSLLPVIQWALIYHNGRAILTNCLPTCDRHKMEYLKEYAELALSLGIFHHLLNESLVYGLSYSGIPTEHYRSLFKTALVILSTGVAAELDFPKAVASSRRNWIDPIDLYQRGVGLVFDLVTLGLKSYGPRIIKELLNNPGETQHWQTINAFINREDTTTVRKILTPTMLHSPEAFIADPLVSDDWPGLKAQIRLGYHYFERFRQDKPLMEQLSRAAKDIWKSPWDGIKNLFIDATLGVASLSPTQSGKLAADVKGLPKSLVTFGIKAINSPTCMTLVDDKANYLLGLSNDPPGELPPAPLPLLQSVVQATNLPPAAPAKNVIKAAPSQSTSPQNKSKPVIKPSNGGLFNSPTNKRSIIRPHKDNPPYNPNTPTPPQTLTPLEL